MRDPDEIGDSHPATGDEDADDDVRKLMMIADKRWELPSAARARVYSATLEAFEAMPEPGPDSQASMRVGDSDYAWRYALAASCVIALGATLLFLPTGPDATTTPAPAVATVLYTEGDSTIDGHQLVSGDELAINTTLETGADGRLQLRLSSGVELRIDGYTRLMLTSNAQVQLLDGRIYLDAADGSTVQVGTPMGNVTDIGTQFVVEVDKRQLGVIVREGAVEVAQGSNTDVARAQPGNGEKLLFSEHGLVSRAAMSTTDPYWHWIGFASIAYKLDSGTLDDYLHKSARECGLQLRYSDSGSQHAAQTIRPYGTTSLSGCLVAIDEVLVTNGLQRISADDVYQLVIDFDKGD